MQNLSALVFSKDSNSKILGLVKELIGVCDQIVLMYSGSRKETESLRQALTIFPKGKISLHRVLALGYPDPLRAYGLSKCKYDLVLYIDTDERLGAVLNRDLKKLADGKYDAFAIRRYENAHLDGEKGTFFTWQIRLYNKKKIYYRGLLHEQPIVTGKLGKLGEEYYMLHVEELKEKGSNRTDREYSLIRKYNDRLSYKMLNYRIKEYLEKLMLPEGQDIEQTATAKFVLGWMRFYEKITLRQMNSEISNFDYFMFYLMIEGAYTIKRRDIKYLFDEAIPTAVRETKLASKFKKEKDSRMVFDISKAMARDGLIKYLMLDNNNIVEKLNKRYMDGEQGVKLLMKLLDDRYNARYPYT